MILKHMGSRKVKRERRRARLHEKERLIGKNPMVWVGIQGEAT